MKKNALYMKLGKGLFSILLTGILVTGVVFGVVRTNFTDGEILSAGDLNVIQPTIDNLKTQVLNEVNIKLEGKADKANYYTKEDIDEMLSQLIPASPQCGIDLYKSGSNCIGVGNGKYSPNNDDVRYSCTNAKPNNSGYSSSGVGQNNCAWSCKSGYIESNGSCVLPPINGECEEGVNNFEGTPYECKVGTPINTRSSNTKVGTFYYWDCKGYNNGTTDTGCYMREFAENP